MNDLEFTTDIDDEITTETDIDETNEADEETLTSLIVRTIALTAASTITMMGVIFASNAVHEKAQNYFAARRLAKAEKIVADAKAAEDPDLHIVQPEDII